MVDCPVPDVLVEEEIDRVLTQYRESPKLLHVIRTWLRQIEGVIFSICDMPSYFDIDTAVGDQLTLLGRRMGFPRNHCICSVQPVFGFECDGIISEYQLAGFCDGNSTWQDCWPYGLSEISIEDDEMYRGFLKARRYQMISLYDMESLTEAIQHLWGETAWVIEAGEGRVVIAPGRDLTSQEASMLQVYPRVLPVAPGIRIRFHFGTVRSVFGFGEGWGAFCERPGVDDRILVTEAADAILVDDGSLEAQLLTGPDNVIDPDWMCEIDVRPYECAA